MMLPNGRRVLFLQFFKKFSIITLKIGIIYLTIFYFIQIKKKEIEKNEFN